MLDFEIKSFAAVGPIRFGMTRENVANLKLGTVKSFKRTPASEFHSDHFVESGVIVSYKFPGVVDAVEFSGPAQPVFLGKRLFDFSVEKLKAFLTNEDPNIEVGGDGFTAHNIGIGAYILGADEDEDVSAELVAIIVFEEDYYTQ